MKISFGCKCSDMSYMTIYDDEGNEIFEHDGYVPSIKGLGSGDYVDIDIDNATGKIIGWVPLSADKIEELKENS